MRSARGLSRLVAVGSVIAGSAAASLVLLSPAGAEGQEQVPTSCEVHELPLPPGGIEGSVTGSSPDGRTLVGEVTTEGTPRGQTVVIWRDGKIVDTVDNAPNTLSDINSNGVAVGGFYDEYGDDRPWVYDNGRIRELPGDVAPNAINDSGLIAGSEADGAVVWPAGSDDPVALKKGAPGAAYDLSEDGTIVGKAAGEAGTDAVFWQHGAPGLLPRPEGTPLRDNLAAFEINGPWVVGAGPEQTVRWNLETGATETIPNVSAAEHSGINERGWIVGSQQSGNQAVMIADGHTFVLPPFKSYPLHYADSISADGSVIGGTAVIPKGESKPVYWSCS